MNLSSNELFKAVRYALYTGTAAAVALTAAPAFAQDPQGETQSLETVTVTGSRIRKADVETAQPILVLDRAAIEKQGFNTVVDILSNLTEAGSPPISRSSVLASGENVGGYYIDMRNLGANRTLVLLNGKRLGATSDGLQDLSQVPVAAVERIEVLKDGASAIYGSDAIAGVVNIITRRNYDGMEASAYVGQYDEGDGTKQTYSMTLGSHNERGSITVAAEYSKEEPTWAKNRPYSRYGNSSRHPLDALTPVSQWGVFFLPNGCPGIEDSPYGACTLNPGGNPFNAGYNNGPNDFHGTNSAGGASDLSNSNEQMMGTTGLDRHSLFVAGEYNITDNIKFSTDILYNKRSTTQQVAGYPFQGGNLSPDSYYNPFGTQHVADPADATNVYFLRRGWEVPRVTRSDLQTYRFSGTLEGSFEIAGRTWNWDVGGYVNTNDLLKTGRGDYSLPAVAASTGASFFNPLTNRVECGTADSPTPYGSGPGQCVPWNPFYPAGTVAPDSLSGNKELQTFLFPFYHDTGRTKTVDYSANLTGSLFSLPAGDVGLATGYEYRSESGRFEPDASKQAGQSTDLAGTMTKGRYSVDEYYVEVDVPVLKDVPFFKELSFNVAARYSDYSTFGDTTNGKFSLTWRPIEDLLVRGNYAEGFRAPTIGDLYGGFSQTFDSYSDPCDTVLGSAARNPDVLARCVAGFGGQNPTAADFRQPRQGGRPCTSQPCQTAIPFMAGSNANLQPETSTSKTAGLVYSPNWIQGLDLSLDWYNVKIKNTIVGDTVSQMLQDCYVFGVESRCSGALFTRDASGAVNTALRAGINQGWQEVEGYDFGVNYRLPEFAFGRFRVSWDTTYVKLNNVKPDDKPDTVVQVQNSFAGFPRIRSNLSLDWSLGDFGATWTTRYYSSMKESCSYDTEGGPECNQPDHVAPDTGADPTNRVGSTTFHDAQIRWTAPWNGTISVGANNLFNKQPPIMYSAPNSQYAYYGGFDIGRFYYLRYTQKF
ncbi:TonB-dependent receptor plug domain-containing protein [Dokdonella ginsengisoli]|uniref:TonB-dependent receptor plug domain-containing protein n=1 Tax=Dokdonella ginsengisoli TaxID=363846 RepID=A0ABV9QUN0_9GAMM